MSGAGDKTAAPPADRPSESAEAMARTFMSLAHRMQAQDVYVAALNVIASVIDQQTGELVEVDDLCETAAADLKRMVRHRRQQVPRSHIKRLAG